MFVKPGPLPSRPAGGCLTDLPYRRLCFESRGGVAMATTPQARHTQMIHMHALRGGCSPSGAASAGGARPPGTVAFWLGLAVDTGRGRCC